MTSPIALALPEELHGPRVLVRPFRPEDAVPLYEAIDESREHLSGFMPWVPFYKSVEDAVVYVNRSRAQWILRTDMPVGLFERETGRLLGSAGLHRINWELRSFEIGYWVRASEEGRGYVSETVQVLTRFAFEQLGANRVEIRMDTRNERSRRVPERLGFTLEGTLRNATLGTDGQPRDSHVWAMVPGEFQALNQ